MLAAKNECSGLEGKHQSCHGSNLLKRKNCLAYQVWITLYCKKKKSQTLLLGFALFSVHFLILKVELMCYSCIVNEQSIWSEQIFS